MTMRDAMKDTLFALQSNLAEPLTLVVFGASGDLTRRKLIPAIFQLWCQDLLPKTSSIVGFARRDLTDHSFRRELRDSTREYLTCRGNSVDDDTWSRFARRIFYHRGEYGNPADFASLRKRIEGTSAANCVYYLATPPTVFVPIIEQLGQAGLARAGQDSPWTRIVIEKPFGHDLQSARELNEQVISVFNENQIFRIDHYLGKETVQNIMVLRLANSVFEHLWSHDYIDHIQITVAESQSVGRRGSYYDKAGALRDIVQNHMMHLLCLVAMEAPTALSAEAIRDEKVKLLRSIRQFNLQPWTTNIVRGRYAEGVVDGEKACGYLQEEGVAA
ncbi:MAG: glucose-6-phosphate dehydrogenase (NADP(+)), partial [Candidatus Hydrogenedentes bacterium]|nr:glucose-6-phosphate dehydrogenase (NADP(+)) [Candidatus Hydrogenedentota bacterium]